MNNITAIFIFFICIIAICAVAIHALDRDIERRCADREMKNPPEYCVEYWAEYPVCQDNTELIEAVELTLKRYSVTTSRARLKIALKKLKKTETGGEK